MGDAPCAVGLEKKSEHVIGEEGEAEYGEGRESSDIGGDLGFGGRRKRIVSFVKMVR